METGRNTQGLVMEMGEDDLADRTSPTVSVDEIPAPVVGYEVPAEQPVIAVTNDSFESAFESVSSGTSVQHWLRDDLGSDEPQVEEVCSALADGGRVDVDLETAGDGGEPGSYRLRTLAESATTEGAEGYVLLTELRTEREDGSEIDRIASVISHDLRNPLDVANAHLRAARETGGDEHFDEVRRSHDRMEQIIQDVLTLARGKNALSIAADIEIGAVANDAWATVDTRGASLTLEDDLPRMEADPDRLQRLFENLFRNSIEHAHPAGNDQGGVGGRGDGGDPDHPLQVRVGPTDGGFFVSDNGTGITEEDRACVFDPGYSSNETSGGTGLGLTIVEEIAEAHGWGISITTGRLGGARFEFRPLPGES